MRRRLTISSVVAMCAGVCLAMAGCGGVPLPFTGSAGTAPAPDVAAADAAAREQRVTELAMELQLLEARRDRQVQLVLDESALVAATRPAPTTEPSVQASPTTWPALQMQQLVELEDQIVSLRRHLYQETPSTRPAADSRD